MRFLPIVLSTTLLAPSLCAAEVTVSDLRLGAGLLSNRFTGGSSTTITNGGNTISTTSVPGDGRDSHRNYRAQLQYVGGRLGAGGGLIWGAGAAINRAWWENGSQDASVTTPIVDVLLGYGYAFTPMWHLELAPFLGIGRSYYRVTDHGSTTTPRSWSKYLEYGGKAGTYVTFGNNVQLGIEIPYLIGSFDPDYGYDDSSGNRVLVSDKRKNRGFGALVTLGVRF